MEKSEVTQAIWERIMRSNPSNHTHCGGSCPVENVSWKDCIQFIEILNRDSELKFRLPTEAEWEYAARTGTRTPFAFGKCPSAKVANFDARFTGPSCPQGKKVAARGRLPDYNYYKERMSKSNYKAVDVGLRLTIDHFGKVPMAEPCYYILRRAGMKGRVNVDINTAGGPATTALSSRVSHPSTDAQRGCH